MLSQADYLRRPVLVAGAGGFIGGHLVSHLLGLGYGRVRAVDKKPLSRWWQRFVGAENLCLDLSEPENARAAVAGCADVYQLAADMGGIGYIENYRVECMRSVLINTHMLEESYRAGVGRFFYSSSACVYNASLQKDPNVTALRESDAYPALAERGYGWEKLYSEMMCQEYFAERGMKTFIARFHNVYGPHGTWDGGREKAPAALCRKVVEAEDTNSGVIKIWGDGTQTRSFMYVDDCVEGIIRIANEDKLVATPVNLGSSHLVSVDDLAREVEGIAGVSLLHVYDVGKPMGVMGRNSDNSLIYNTLHWEPTIALPDGLRKTYAWVRGRYYARKEGLPVVEDIL